MEVRIDQEDSVDSKREKVCIGNVLGRRHRWEWVCCKSRRSPGLAVERRWAVGGSWKESGRLGKKRRRAVELEVVLGLQDVIKNSEASADTGLAGPPGVPGKSDSRRPVVLGRKIDSARGTGVSRVDEVLRCIGKYDGLVTRNNVESASLRVVLWRAVLVPDSQC